MDLYVRCTLEYLDTSFTEHFAGKLLVDPSEGSFKVVVFKPNGRKEEHKFFANEFTPLCRPPVKSTAQQFPLVFDISKQHSGRFHKRKHILVIKTSDHSQKIKDIYEELKTVFSRKSQNFRTSSLHSSPVGMLRSHPDLIKNPRPERRHRVPKFIFDDPLPNCSGSFSPEPESKKPPSVSGRKPVEESRGLRNEPAMLPNNSAESLKAGSMNVVVQEVGKPSSSNDVIEIVNIEPPSAVNSKALKLATLTGENVMEGNGIVKSKVTNDLMKESVEKSRGGLKAVPNMDILTGSSDERPTDLQIQSRKKQQNTVDKSVQGSIISLVEQDVRRSSGIRVSAPYKAGLHTVTFKQKRGGDRSPTKPSLAKRLASSFGSEPIPKDAAVNLNGLSTPSFYSSPRSSAGTRQPQRFSHEFTSPRPQLLAESISSSRCLLSPPKVPRSFGSSSIHVSRDDVTSSRKRKEIDDSYTKDFVNKEFSSSLSSGEAENQPSPYSYRGLENLTNSCYMNATLQALATVFPFYYRMQMIQQRQQEEGYECSEFFKRFNDVLHNLVSPDRESDMKYGCATKVSVLEALRTAAGKELGSDPDFGSNMQQDAHEFLAKTLETLEKEALHRKRKSSLDDETMKNTSEFASPASSSRNPAGVFQHKIRDRFGCERCARANEMTNDAIDLTVTVSAGESIQKMIENALAREEIEYKCDNCGTGAGFISRAFATLPQSLIVVVKRYRFGEAGGSKVEEKIGVSRELFLKNLFVDSEVKKREGVARQSLPESANSLVGNPRENGRSDDSGVNSEVESVATVLEEASQKNDSAAPSNGSIVSVNDEEVEILSDSHLIFDHTKKGDQSKSVADSQVQTDKDAFMVFPLAPISRGKRDVSTPGTSICADFIERSEQPCSTRLALSPLKINRSASGKDETISESFDSPRKVEILENIDLDISRASSTSDCIVIDEQEKENSLLCSLKLGTEASSGVIKQRGGYLKENTPDIESARSGDGSTASREVADVPNDTASASTQSVVNLLEKDVNSVKLTGTMDVPNKRARLEDRTEKAVETTSAQFVEEPSTSYARQVTEPLRPSSRTLSKSAAVPATLEQISVIGEVEERITLIFRPVDEEYQKRWCERFGLKYIGSLERRKKIFGREIEFSVRDIPQRCEVRGDGNCLFRTLCWWITGGSERDHMLLREKLVSFMRRYRSYFSSLLFSQQDMDAHLERMSQDGEWGTQVELAAAACWLGVNIYTFLEGKWLRYRQLFRWKVDGSTPIPLSRSDCNDDKGAIFICNASGCHFQPAIGVEPHVTRRSLRPRKDREFVKENSPIHGTPEPPYIFNAADGPVYSLSAVICHHGDSLLTGHYSTFALDVTRREWLDCNDHIITKVSEVEVIDNSSSSGYIFIYNRVEDPFNRL